MDLQAVTLMPKKHNLADEIGANYLFFLLDLGQNIGGANVNWSPKREWMGLGKPQTSCTCIDEGFLNVSKEIIQKKKGLRNLKIA